MEKLIEILQEIDDTIDYETEKALVSDGLLTSLDLTALISELEDAFDIEISMDELTPENFDSLEAMQALIGRLSD